MARLIGSDAAPAAPTFRTTPKSMKTYGSKRDRRMCGLFLGAIISLGRAPPAPQPRPSRGGPGKFHDIAYRTCPQLSVASVLPFNGRQAENHQGVRQCGNLIGP